jgi:hypothetical protein
MRAVEHANARLGIGVECAECVPERRCGVAVDGVAARGAVEDHGGGGFGLLDPHGGGAHALAIHRGMRVSPER